MRNFKKFILIAIDTLNVDHVGCYGYNIPREPVTPFLDSLASEGVIFLNHYASDVPTPSSYTSLFTGRRGIKHGIIGFRNTSEEFICPTPLLAECFSQAGFQTGMISNLLYPCPWLVRGFQYIYPPGLRFQGGDAEEVTEKSIHWLDDHYQDNFFLFLHYWDPHVPYTKRGKDKFKKLFSPEEYNEYAPSMEYFERNPILKKIYELKQHFTGDSLDPRENLAHYDANIRYVDECIGELFHHLEKLKIREDTLIVITSDHGEAFGEYGFWDHYSSYRNISQLLLLFVGEGLPKGKKIQAYTQNIDVMPTLLEFAEIEIPPSLCGRSLLPLLKGERDDFRKEIVVNSDATVIQRMFVKDGYALVHTLSRPVWDHIKKYELFNLHEDPHQLRDISQQEEEKFKEMKVYFIDWLAEELGDAPDPLWKSVFRGGWMWGTFARLLGKEEWQKVVRKYPVLEKAV